MPNVITPYDPLWYANRALERLEKSLSFVRTMYRGYDAEPRTKGSTIEIKKPGGFVAEQMPIASKQDMSPTKIQMTLNQWFGVQFAIGDKEHAYTGDKIVSDHIAPAMQALGEKIETSCVRLIKRVPWLVDGADPAVISDLTKLRRILNDNHVSKAGRFLAITGEREEDLLNLSVFNEADKSSDGGMTQREGSMGRKYGFDIFQNDSLENHTAGTLSDTTPLLQGAHVKGATAVVMDDVALTGTLVEGDTFVIAGNSQRYAVTALATAAGNVITAQITPELVQNYADNAGVTVRLASKALSCAYRSDAFAIAMAPLRDDVQKRGVEIATVTDPNTGLAIRVTRWYEAKEAEDYIRFDALWGVKELDVNQAVRWEGPLL